MLCLVAGRLLSAGYSHVRPKVGQDELPLPFLNAHKFLNADNFRRHGAEDLRGVKTEVLRWNEVFEGKSLPPAKSKFFILVGRWKTG